MCGPFIDNQGAMMVAGFNLLALIVNLYIITNFTI